MEVMSELYVDCEPKIVCVSGYFDPIHIGHIEYFKKSKMIGDILMVIVNNDDQATSRGKRSSPYPLINTVKINRFNLGGTIRFYLKYVI